MHSRNAVLLGILIIGGGGAIAAAVLAMIKQGTATYRMEVWVRAKFVDAATLEPVAGLEVRTIPRQRYAQHDWVQTNRRTTGVSADSSEPMFLVAFGLTDSDGSVLLKVLVSRESREVEPFGGVHFVWTSGFGKDRFLDTRPIGRWKETGGSEPFATLELGTIRLKKN